MNIRVTRSKVACCMGLVLAWWGGSVQGGAKVLEVTELKLVDANGGLLLSMGGTANGGQMVMYSGKQEVMNVSWSQEERSISLASLEGGGSCRLSTTKNDAGLIMEVGKLRQMTVISDRNNRWNGRSSIDYDGDSVVELVANDVNSGFGAKSWNFSGSRGSIVRLSASGDNAELVSLGASSSKVHLGPPNVEMKEGLSASFTKEAGGVLITRRAGTELKWPAK